MDLGPQPPPPLTLTQGSTPPDKPPKRPPEVNKAAETPKKALKQAMNNPFRDINPTVLEELHKCSISEAISATRAPFRYHPKDRFTLSGAPFGDGITTDTFHSAVVMVIAALDRGYFSEADPTPLSPSEWAKLACTMISAIGRGYGRQEHLVKEETLDRVRAGATDPHPLLPEFHTLFHRLSATADQLEHNTGVDQDGYKDWYDTIKENFMVKANKSAQAEVEESWRLWKADQIDRRADAQEAEIWAAVRDRNARYLFTAAAELGLPFASQNPSNDPCKMPTTGKKRTVSGSTPAARPSTPISFAGPSTPIAGPSTPVALRINPPRAAKRTPPPTQTTPSPITTPRGWPPRPSAPTATRADPSPTPQPRKTLPGSQTLLTAGPKVAERPMEPPQIPKQPPPSGDNANTAILQAILARLEALEHRGANAAGPLPLRTPATDSRTAAPSGSSNDRHPALPTEEPRNSSFTQVERNKKRKKGTGNTGTNPITGERPAQINLTPASYAKTATKAASILQGPVPAKPARPPPGITEVTVLRSGGHINPLTEQHIRSRAADAIIREVRLNIAKAVAKPIPLRAGRWSIGPHSKGNFVFSFDGCIPFDVIMSYEHILLGPFHGSGQLRPSLGWTRLLAHGVPFTDNNGDVFGPDILLSEIKTLPGLKKVHFAMEPRWLRPIESINSIYSTITFAISDPDSSATSTLLTERTALFGKEVTMRKWIDKPALVQCSRCHALGHIKTSNACPLGKDSIRCHICGGAHRSEEHNQKCPRKHTTAGICDCKNYKCLNCQSQGHHCRDSKCPAREKYRPRHARKTGRGRDKGKEKAHAEPPAQPPASTSRQGENTGPYHPPTEEEFADHFCQGMGDFERAWGNVETPDPTLESRTTMEIDSELSRSTPLHTPNNPPSQRKDYSPSHPHSSAASQSLN
jgi:hypothetical protein